MIKWPERAKVAIKKLFEPLQDIDVYVEDTNNEVFYTTLLKRVSQGNIRIAKVFALGGRKAVEDFASTYDHSQRRALFLIDGDLEWVRGIPPKNIVGLHQHDAYCIENLLLCEKAISQILAPEIIMTEEDAALKLNFSTWIESIQNPLLELFSAFATAHQFSPEEQTVAQRVGNMCTQKNKINELDIEKVNLAKNKALAAAAAKIDQQKVEEVYQQNLARLRSLTFPLNAVSGKDFLLPLLNFLLQSLGCPTKTKVLKIKLANAGDINRFSSLFQAMEEASLGHGLSIK